MKNFHVKDSCPTYFNLSLGRKFQLQNDIVHTVTKLSNRPVRCCGARPLRRPQNGDTDPRAALRD